MCVPACVRVYGSGTRESLDGKHLSVFSFPGLLSLWASAWLCVWGGPRVSTLTNGCWHRPDEAALRALPAQPRPWPQGVGNAFKLRFPNLRQPTPPPDGPFLTWPAPPDQHNLLALSRGSCSLRLTPSWRPSLTTLERSLATWLLSYAGMYLSFFPLFLAELCAVS